MSAHNLYRISDESKYQTTRGGKLLDAGGDTW